MISLKLLRAFLGLSAATWGAAVFGIFLGWDTAAAAMEGMGADPIAYDRMLDYWLRMASGAFALIGALYLLLMFQPKRYREMIPWFGIFALVEGVVLLVHGLRLSLPPMPFYGDVAACFAGGIGILICWRRSKPVLYD